MCTKTLVCLKLFIIIIDRVCMGTHTIDSQTANVPSEMNLAVLNTMLRQTKVVAMSFLRKEQECAKC